MFRLVGSAPPEILGGLKSDTFRAKLQKHLGQVHQYHVLGEFLGTCRFPWGPLRRTKFSKLQIPFTCRIKALIAEHTYLVKASCSCCIIFTDIDIPAVFVSKRTLILENRECLPRRKCEALTSKVFSFVIYNH